jgi:hypothetical protein
VRAAARPTRAAGKEASVGPRALPAADTTTPAAGKSENEAWFADTIWGQPVDRPFDPARVRPGHLDLTVLYQNRFWVDVTGRCWELTAMSPAYRAAVVGFLHGQAAGIHRIEAEAEDLGAVCSAAQFLLTRALDLPRIRDIDPSDFIEATPMVRALRGLSPDIPPAAELAGHEQP